MKQITEITAQPNQRLELVTEDNQAIELRLEYSDQQQGWFYGFTFNDLVVNGMRLVTSLNTIRHYKNIIPFGFSILTDDGSEPIFINDLSNERVRLFLLNEQEVEEVEVNFYNK